MKMEALDGFDPKVKFWLYRFSVWCAVIMGFVALFFYFFVVITSLQMRRAEGGFGLLSFVQLISGVVAAPGWLYLLSQVAVAAYRPERSPAIAQVLPMAAFPFWKIMMIWGLFRAIKPEEQEEKDAALGLAPA